ncbi:MAG: SDR family oxidoreductase [Spirochaetales bacterium]|nr:SDR family oxidoreductase [Spirochaetales bacterium]
MSLELKDKVCVVTGAAGSIGLAIAEMYGRLGARVGLIDRDPTVREQARRLAGEGCSARGWTLDITEREAVLARFEAIAVELGPVFALANVAGLVDQQPFEEITAERLERILRVNVNGTVFCSQGALKSMKGLGDGRIINFSSKSGKTGSALMAAYSASKGAIIALTQAMAYEYADRGIKINCVCPGVVEDTAVWSSLTRDYAENLKTPPAEVTERFTAKVPLGRLGRTADLVSFVRFLTVDADYCTGQAFNISGGREMH